MELAKLSEIMRECGIVGAGGAGIGAAIGQFGITAAYRFSAPGSVAVFDYTNIIFTAALGFMFFGQIPDRWSVMGYAAIVMAAMVMRKKG